MVRECRRRSTSIRSRGRCLACAALQLPIGAAEVPGVMPKEGGIFAFGGGKTSEKAELLAGVIHPKRLCQTRCGPRWIVETRIRTGQKGGRPALLGQAAHAARTGKPSSVPASRRATAISLDRRLPAGSSTRPVPNRGPRLRPGEPETRNCLRLHEVGFAVPRPSPVGRCALTAPFHPYRGDSAGPRGPSPTHRGGLFSVALSLTLQRVGGRYPPPCPPVLGLSSRPRSDLSDQPRTSDRIDAP